jgi:prophage regulatory protein
MTAASEQLNKALTILRRRQVEARTGLSRSTIYLKISRQEFPAPIHLGVRAVGWPEAAIEQWLQERVAASAGK